MKKTIKIFIISILSFFYFQNVKAQLYINVSGEVNTSVNPNYKRFDKYSYIYQGGIGYMFFKKRLMLGYSGVFKDYKVYLDKKQSIYVQRTPGTSHGLSIRYTHLPTKTYSPFIRILAYQEKLEFSKQVYDEKKIPYKQQNVSTASLELGIKRGWFSLSIAYNHTFVTSQPLQTMSLRLGFDIDFPEEKLLKAAFSYEKDNSVVYFTNQSNIEGTYQWDFDDGTSSKAENPKHLYVRNGTFFPKLTIEYRSTCSSGDDSFSSCMESISMSNQIIIDQPELDILRSDFTYKKLLNNEVVFINMSKNADSYFWDFGDGETSKEESPKHIYAKQGNYTVKFDVKNKKQESDSVSKLIIID